MFEAGCKRLFLGIIFYGHLINTLGFLLPGAGMIFT